MHTAVLQRLQVSERSSSKRCYIKGLFRFLNVEIQTAVLQRLVQVSERSRCTLWFYKGLFRFLFVPGASGSVTKVRFLNAPSANGGFTKAFLSVLATNGVFSKVCSGF